MLSAAVNVTPISMPLVETALASQARLGDQMRTRVGNAGWKIATPKPIARVAA